MTVQNATLRYVSLSTVVNQVRLEWETKKNPIRRRQLRSFSNNLKSWGDCAIYENKELRHIVAASVAYRLGLAFNYVKDRMDKIHRVAKYEE